jgi:2'-5' RNA ligase
MPRLFTGLELPEDIVAELDLMRGGVHGARWIEPESYHITLRFVGDVEDKVARDLIQALDTVSAPVFSLKLKGIGAFGGAKPHSIHVGVADSPELKRLRGAHERVCQVIGLAPEQRKFTPHVTLARLKQARPDAVQRFIAAHNLYASRPFEVLRFVLFSSRPSRGGGPYAMEETYGLRRSGALAYGQQRIAGAPS